MGCQAISCRGRNPAWLGLLIVAGGLWTALALPTAGRSQTVGPPVAVSAQSAAQANPVDRASEQSGAVSDGPESDFRSTARKKEDRVEVQVDEAKDERLLIVLRSPSGIGAAVVERSRGQWPAQVVVRLHLGGLESFRAETQRAALSLSVLSHAENERLMKLSVNDQAQQIKPGTPTGVEVRAFDAQGKPVEGLPPAGGWFEVRLPGVMFRNNPAAVRLGWIDFYRG